MKFAADTSEELGMSLQGSMFAFGSALDRRQKSMDLQGVSQGRLNSTIQTTIKSQRTYSMALGVSTDTMDAFIDSMLANTGALNATLIGFNGNMRNNVMAGMEVFASGMRGLGGEAGNAGEGGGAELGAPPRSGRGAQRVVLRRVLRVLWEMRRAYQAVLDSVQGMSGSAFGV